MKLLRLIAVVVIALVGLVIIRSGSAQSRSAADPITPHLGYGFNVLNQIDLANGTGFDWIKLFDDFGPPPATRLPYKVLYRISVDGYPPSMAAFLQHVRDLVDAGRGKVEAYEVGNEPNLFGTGFWGHHTVDPFQYAQVLCSAYTVIKQEDPHAIVVSAGLAPVGRTAPDYWHLAWDERTYAQQLFDDVKSISGGSFCMDAFGYHPHGFVYAPETDYNSVPNGFTFRGSEAMHDVMLAEGAVNMKMWATEFGWIRDPHDDPWIAANGDLSSFGWCNNDKVHQLRGFRWMEVSEQQQADYLVRAFQYADDNWPWMGPMFVWNLDFYDKGICIAQQFYSMFHATENDPTVRSPALAYTALISMPKRYALDVPELSVKPDQLIFLTEVNTPTVQTETFNISNLTPWYPLTWTLSISGSIVQPQADRISGTTDATITVWIDPSPIGISGTYSASLMITAQPTLTIGSPLAIPIDIIAVVQLNRAYLPLIDKNYAAPAAPPITSTPHFTGGLQMGLNFVSSAEAPAQLIRYQYAQGLGAALNRYPFYWYNIEKNPLPQPRVFDWSRVDANVISDTNQGLSIDAILLGTPPDLATGGSALAPRPQIGDGLRLLENRISTNGPASISSVASPPIGLYDGIFANGIITDDVPGKPINPNNRWAYFVTAVVNRYKPGGTLAQSQNWISGTGITHWEIWNEEDLDYFFSGTITDYARLLKVAYLSAKTADPHAEIIFGGMAHFQKPGWLNDVLNVIATDPLSSTNQAYMDALASHSYAWSWQTFNYLYQDRSQLNARGLDDVRLWLTETGVPVCDDPAPAANPPIEPFCPSAYRSTMSEQADYLIQTMTFAQWLNTEAAFWFQLYDDCGNDGRYDAHGLVRNPMSGPCTPRDGTPRPSYTAYQVFVDNILGAQPYWRKRPTTNQELIAFKRPDTGERVVVMWARSNVTETVALSATASSAQLISPNGSIQSIFPINGVYSITLPAATNYSSATNDGSAAIGGDPRILIELDPAVVP